MIDVTDSELLAFLDVKKVKLERVPKNEESFVCVWNASSMVTLDGTRYTVTGTSVRVALLRLMSALQVHDETHIHV